MAKVVENIGTLKINLLSQEDYDAEVQAGTVEPNELYLTPSSGSGVSDVEVNGTSVVSGGVAEVTVPTDTSDLTNGAGYITSYTDTNVTQTNATPSSYTYWRPLIVGNSSNVIVHSGLDTI